MSQELSHILDLDQFQKLLGGFHELTGISASLIDNSGNMLASSIKTTLCSRFYNTDSTQSLLCQLHRGALQQITPQPPIPRITRCPHGLSNAVEPVIIQGETLGALILGEVFLKEPDIKNYRKEAAYFGFNQELFIQALRSVPVISTQQFEQAIQHMHNLISYLVEQSSKHLSVKNNLVTAQKQAESSKLLAAELLANLSHELRTPLNGVIGGAQLLRFTQLSPEQSELIDIIETASNLELSVVNNLLELVQLENEPFENEQVPFHLLQCIEGVVQEYAEEARKKDLIIGQELQGSLPEEVEGNRSSIQQALRILVDNAIKFTAHGGVTIRVSSEQRTTKEALVRFSVFDTGIGIKQTEITRIFEPFIQLDMSASRNYGGLGLGLAICQRLATALHGRVWAESVPQTGSCFHLELPLVLPSPTVTVDHFQHDLLVLVAEDDRSSTQMSEALLRKMGCHVVTAQNSTDVITTWQNKKIDLLLLDDHFAMTNGFETLQHIRRLEKELHKPRTPVVMQCASVRRNGHRTLPGADIDGFISKPLLRTELEVVLASCCNADNHKLSH